jgi:hypothetical protein
MIRMTSAALLMYFPNAAMTDSRKASKVLKYFRLYAHLGSDFPEINCPQADEKARLEKNEIGKGYGCLENFPEHSPQESVPDSCYSFSFR